MPVNARTFDLLVVGGGINGAGIARDAAGRGLSVLLVEKDDLASATSSWSTKLIHGGLRYLEHYEFRLVGESLAEREVVLRIAPHIVEPLSFVLPHEPHLRPGHGLQCYAISSHLVGQAVCDPIDARHKSILPERVWGDGNKEGVRKRAAAEMITTAKAAAKFGVKVVNGFTGSSVWHKLYFFPPTSPKEIDDGFKDFGKRWTPILDEFAAVGVKFGLEVHPGEIAYDIYTAQRAIDAVNGHPAFGFNFDPSHLLWQGVDPAIFIDTFRDRIWHVHMKDVATNMNGTASILGSHLAFGDHRRGWDFRSVGRGHVDFDAIIRALNRANYQGPLSVEWEDAGMDREHGAKESCDYVRGVDFTPSGVAFDAAFDKEEKAKK